MYKKILINSIIIFLFSSLIHFLYNSLPYFFTAVFAPVNESIWEHMKMTFSSYMLLLLIKLLFNKKYPHNLVSSYVISALINIIIFIIIYTPISSILNKEIMWLTLTICFITILISNYALYKIQIKKDNKRLNKIMSISIFFIYLIFTLFTYYPPKISIFYDKDKSLYGIYKFYF